jgi:hypothetical protein
MSQPAASEGQPRLGGGGAGFFSRMLQTVRFQENGWQEPCESRGSRTDLRGTGGEIPPVYPTLKIGQVVIFYDITGFQRGGFLPIISIYMTFL